MAVHGSGKNLHGSYAESSVKDMAELQSSAGAGFGPSGNTHLRFSRTGTEAN